MRLGDIKIAMSYISLDNLMLQLKLIVLGSSYFSHVFHSSAAAGRRIHIHRLWPLRGTSDGRGSNRRPAGERASTKRHLSYNLR